MISFCKSITLFVTYFSWRLLAAPSKRWAKSHFTFFSYLFCKILMRKLWKRLQKAYCWLMQDLSPKRLLVFNLLFGNKVEVTEMRWLRCQRGGFLPSEPGFEPCLVSMRSRFNIFGVFIRIFVMEGSVVWVISIR